MPRYITCFDEHLIKLLEEKEIAQSSAKADDIAVSRPGATTRSISRKTSQQQPPSPAHHDDTVIEVNAAPPEQGIEHHADHGPAITGVDEHTLLDTGPHHSTTLEFNLESRRVTTADSKTAPDLRRISSIQKNIDRIFSERSEGRRTPPEFDRDVAQFTFKGDFAYDKVTGPKTVYVETDLRDDESLNSTAMALINGVNMNSHGLREPSQLKEVAHPPMAHMNSVLSLQQPPPGHKPIDNRVPDTHVTVPQSGVFTTAQRNNQPQHMPPHTTAGGTTPGPVPGMPRATTITKEHVRTHDQQLGVVPAPPASQKKIGRASCRERV